MPVPGSGQLRLRADIANEVDGDDTGTNVSLGTLSNTAGFTEPDKMSDFYGYTSCTAPSVNTPTSSSQTTTSVAITFTGNANGCALTGVEVGYSTSSSGTYTYVAGSHSSETGSYTINKTITGLSSNTTYYFRGKATNSAGTTIGSGILTQATEYDYSFKGVNYYANYQNINNSDAFFWKSYYQHINGSYTLKNTFNSSYNFAISGINGLGQMEFSQNRNCRANIGFTSVADGCTGPGYGTVINAGSDGSYPSDTGVTFANFSTLWSTDCRSGYSYTWTLQSLDRAISLSAHKETGHEFGCQFTI